MEEVDDISPTTSEWEELHNVDTRSFFSNLKLFNNKAILLNSHSHESAETESSSSDKQVLLTPESLEVLCAKKVCGAMTTVYCIDVLPIPPKLRNFLRDTYYCV